MGVTTTSQVRKVRRRRTQSYCHEPPRPEGSGEMHEAPPGHIRVHGPVPVPALESCSGPGGPETGLQMVTAERPPHKRSPTRGMAWGPESQRRSQSSPVSGHSPPGGDLTQQDLMFMEFTDPQSSRWYHVEKTLPRPCKWGARMSRFSVRDHCPQDLGGNRYGQNPQKAGANLFQNLVCGLQTNSERFGCTASN